MEKTSDKLLGLDCSERNRTAVWTVVIVLFLSALFAGCQTAGRYAHDKILEEYALDSRVEYNRSAPGAEKRAIGSDSPLGLPEAIEIALSDNPGIKTAMARIRRAQAESLAAEAPFYPNFSLYTEYVEGDAPSVYLFKKIDQRQLPPGVDFNDPGKIRNFESGATARFNLYNGGRDSLGLLIAETGEAVSVLNLQEAENNLVAAVIEIYYNALAAKSLIVIAEESIKTVEAQLRIMKVRYRAGGALKSDILSLEVRLAEAEEGAEVARNNYLITLNALAGLMGIDPDPPPVLADEGFAPPRLPEHYLGGVAMSLDLRPELLKIRRQVEQSRMKIDMARAGYLPRVDLEGTYYLNDENMDYDTDRENWTVGVMLNWDIFTGFSTKSEELKAEAALEEMLAVDRKTALSVVTDVKNAYLNADSARARMKAAESAVVSAEESLELVKKQYEGGSATITRYLQAELDRNRARTRATSAYYDRQKAVAEIGRAVGYWAKARPVSTIAPTGDENESEKPR